MQFSFSPLPLYLAFWSAFYLLANRLVLFVSIVHFGSSVPGEVLRNAVMKVTSTKINISLDAVAFQLFF